MLDDILDLACMFSLLGFAGNEIGKLYCPFSSLLNRFGSIYLFIFAVLHCGPTFFLGKFWWRNFP